MFDKFKKSLIIFSLILTLFLIIAPISASEDNLTDSSLESSEVNINELNTNDVSKVSDNPILGKTSSGVVSSSSDASSDVLGETSGDVVSSSSDASSDVLGETSGDVVSSSSDASSDVLGETSSGVVSSSSENNLLTSSNGESSSSSDNKIINRVYQSTQVECSPMTQQYTLGSVFYQFKLYDIVSYDGVQYKEPKYGSTVKLSVYTGKSFKNYYGTVDNNGIVSVAIPKLAIGKHNINIYDGNTKRGSSYIKIVKSKTNVYAPTKTLKLKKNSFYKIKVLDSHYNVAKSVSLKVKVYTGKKFKTYTIKTNSKGVAKLQTKSLASGTHKITITTKNKKYKISKNTKIIIKKSVPKTVEKLSVSAPSANVLYKQNNYFDITVKNNYYDPVNKLVLKVKVYTGNKYKTYSLKTNSKGVAKLQTKSLAVGSHKLIINTNNKNYKVSKTAKVVVKNTIDDGLTKLKSLTYYPSGNNYYAKLTWYSKAGTSYQILKKTNGNYNVISTVNADSDNAAFYDKISNDESSTYSVRELLVTNNGNVIGPYDVDGLKLIKSIDVNADFQNLKATIKWSKSNDATAYRVFRKLNRDAEYKCIAVVDANTLSYDDYYYNSATELSSILDDAVFADPSFNSLFYTVRAVNTKQVSGVQKVSYGLYLKDGDFHLESPAIVSLQDNTLKWGEVPNAEGYEILKSDTGNVWVTIAKTTKKDATVNSIKLDSVDNNSYYSVRAFASKNGAMAYSGYDTGFTLKHFSEENSKYRILWFGDSITYGSPYKSTSSRHIFSMPYRVAQLTGCTYYNPSIPGSTYHDLGVKEDGTNVENTNYYRYRICREVVDQIANGELPGNWQSLDTSKNSEGVSNTRISDYNIVVLSAGTNDYLDNTVLGDINSNDVSTFNGALNHIFEQIVSASNNRIAKGESAIKLVLVDLFYSDRTYTYKQVNNRDTTPNKIGLLLGDYQNALLNQLEKWKDKLGAVYNFKTRDYNIVNSDNCPYTASDNLHFTKFVYGQYGNALAQFFLDNVFD